MKGITFVLILLVLPLQALAQSIAVTSGEHDRFTRVVFSLSKPSDWTVTRIGQGYQFSVGATDASFDLSDIYRRLSSGRLAKAKVDPENGAVTLEIGCSCHAIPFELRAGVVVLDIKDGPPPVGSSFERTASGALLPPISGSRSYEAVKRPQTMAATTAEPDRQLDAAIAEASRIGAMSQRPERVTGSSEVVAAREALLWELGRGASNGLIDLTRAPTGTGEGDAPGIRNVSIGALPALDVNARSRRADSLTGDGTQCFTAEQLNVAAWGAENDVVGSFSAANTGIVGELDHPNIEAVERATKFLIALGFGVEARALMQAMQITVPNRDMLEGLSYIVDQEIPPQNSFAGMEVCDSPASLWALLALAELPPGDRVAIPAVLRSFADIPLHLRRHLGPGLAERFLLKGDESTVRSIMNAINRAPGTKTAGTELMEAELALAVGELASAEQAMEILAGKSDPTGLKSLARLIETRTEAGETVAVELTVTAEAMLAQARGGEDEAMLRIALAMGYASQDRFERAFMLVADDSRESAALWKSLASHGSNQSLLQFAILPREKTLPPIQENVRLLLSMRLRELGFPDAALVWSNPAGPDATPPSEIRRLEIAKAELARRDATSALHSVAGISSDAADLIRAHALSALGADGAVSMFRKVSDPDGAMREARKQRRWAELSELSEGDIWGAAAGLLDPARSRPEDSNYAEVPVPEGGLLARSRLALEESRHARDILQDLLSQQTMPRR